MQWSQKREPKAGLDTSVGMAAQHGLLLLRGPQNAQNILVETNAEGTQFKKATLPSAEGNKRCKK